MSSGPFAGLLAEITRVRGVSGCMIVAEADGLIVGSVLEASMRGPAVAALAASLYRKARLAAQAAGFGAAAFMQLEAEQGRVCAVGRGGLVLVAVAEPRANVGLIRVELLRAAEGLAA